MPGSTRLVAAGEDGREVEAETVDAQVRTQWRMLSRIIFRT